MLARGWHVESEHGYGPLAVVPVMVMVNERAPALDSRLAGSFGVPFWRGLELEMASLRVRLTDRYASQLAVNTRTDRASLRLWSRRSPQIASCHPSPHLGRGIPLLTHAECERSKNIFPANHALQSLAGGYGAMFTLPIPISWPLRDHRLLAM